jgi:hypothetical protein
MNNPNAPAVKREAEEEWGAAQAALNRSTLPSIVTQQ